MNFDLTRTLITDAIKGLTFPLQIEWENGRQKPAPPWARISILPGKSDPAIIGPGHVRTTGLISVQVFLPEDSGVKLANDTADVMAGLNTRQLASGGHVVTLETVSMNDSGSRSGYVQKNVWLPFTADTYG